jgi:chromosomal replication initiation ATPase DnaA
MTAGTFNTWVRKTRLVARKENHFIVSVKNHYAKNWPEHRLATTIRRSLNNMVKAEPHAAPAPIEIDFVVEGQPAEN